MGFSSYARHRIRGAIFDELRRLDWVPRGTRERMRDAQRAIDTLSGRLDRHPTDQEVAKELGIEPEAYRASLGEGITLVSLSAVGAPGNGEPTLMDSVEDVSAPDPFLAVAEQERRALLGRLIDDLPERERQALALYYYEELTMREIGTIMGVTESRVSQLHASAVLRLRMMLRRQRIGAGELSLERGGAQRPLDELITTRAASLVGRLRTVFGRNGVGSGGPEPNRLGTARRERLLPGELRLMSNLVAAEAELAGARG